MNRHELTPAQALQSCLDTLINDIQAHVLRFSDRTAGSLMPSNDDTLVTLFDRLAAASRFVADSRSAVLCQGLCRDWQVLQTKTGVSRDRQILLGAGRWCETWRAKTAGDVVRQLLIDKVRAAIDRLKGDPQDQAPEQGWLQETLAGCTALVNAGYFVNDVAMCWRRQPPSTSRDLLRWLCMLREVLERSLEKSLETSLTPDETVPYVPRLFRRELTRCLECCCRATSDEGISPYLWQLQLLAGALMAVAGTGHCRQSQVLVRHHCQWLLISAAQAQLQLPPGGEVDQQPVRRALRHALLLSRKDLPGCVCLGDGASVTPAGTLAAGVALAPLPGPVSTRMQALLTDVADKTRTSVDWAAVSLRLYRALVCLRMPGEGLGDTDNGQGRYTGLVRWQALIASLHTCVDHCLQRSVVTMEDQDKLLALLHRLSRHVHSESGLNDAELLPDTVLVAARLNLRAQRHWQRLTLDLDAAQQDFAGVSVQQVLARELHCLPGMGTATGRSAVLPQDVLRDLRLLLKGARILNVQRIESLALVMIEVYEEMLANPAFAEAADIGKALPRAHRSLCRMLDQAAAWQTPGNARRMINTLYVCLERGRGNGGFVSAPAAVANIKEPPAGQDNDPWQLCLAGNRRLRKLLRHQEDLGSIRVLLLELLRSQEDIMRRHADYGAVPDALQGRKRL